jgi:hypothetical protein
MWQHMGMGVQDCAERRWVLCRCRLQEVQSVQFNILVTTYETIMRDRWA